MMSNFMYTKIKFIYYKISVLSLLFYSIFHEDHVTIVRTRNNSTYKYFLPKKGSFIKIPVDV